MKKFCQLVFFVLVATILSMGPVSAQSVEVDIAAAGYEVGVQDGIDLGLSSLQTQKIEALDQTYLAGKRVLQDQIRTKRDALRQEMFLENLDRAKLQSMANEILAIQEKIVADHIDHIFKIQDVLTPEQRKKLYSMRTEKLQAELKAQAAEEAQRTAEKKKEKKPPLFPPPANMSKDQAEKKK